MAKQPRKHLKTKGTTSKATSKGPITAKIASYLKKLSTAVRDHFASATDLPTFLSGAGQLTLVQRKLIVEQALILIEQNYAHLPLKRAMHSVEPVHRLKLLLQTLELTPSAGQPTEVEFHREMTNIFTSVRDLHTNYLLPAPFNQMTAFLPFIVEDYFEGGQHKYLVSHVVPGFNHATFVPGVEVVYWNGMPIRLAVANSAERYGGSNRDARHARGMQTLTARALRISPPPDEEWVVVGYRMDGGPVQELRLDWQVNPPLPAGSADEAAADQAGLGVDLEQEIIQGLRKMLFAPQVVTAEKKAIEKSERGATLADLETAFPGTFDARSVTTPSGTFGYLRIRTFGQPGPEDFVNEFIRLISGLPQNGLILDVRGNGGGIINSGEFILQTLTPRRIEPEPLQFYNTALNLEICRRHGPTSQWTDLSAWVESMQQALQTGATFSAGIPISDPGHANAIGQKYFGPVVLITDALCYSTTDIFAAGFQDHEIGPILGIHGHTGAGGANVWEHRFFVNPVLPNSVYKPLPNGAGMRVAIRRTLRVGRRAGSPVEDLGVVPDHLHPMTQNDLLNNNVDLINKAASLLPTPARTLTVTVQPSSPTQSSVTVAVQGMTRLDVYLEDRPTQSLDLQAGQATFNISKSAGAPAALEIRGFDGTQIVARYRTTI